jgi:phospholipid/cholesterol/gamma-HCH transport system substrate-binding protein
MMRTARDEASVGAFVVIGFVLLSLLLIFVSGVTLFKSGYAVNVVYRYVSILDRGAPVRMAGVRIGEVSQVDLRFDPESGQTMVHVKVFIQKGVDVRENYQFNIRGTHILSEPHIEITPQGGDFPPLTEGKVVRGVDPVAMEDLIDHANEITSGLSQLVGGVQEVFQDQEVGEVLGDLIRSLANVSRSLETVLEGEEEDMKQTIVNLKSSTDSIDRILGRIDHGEGTLGKLLVQDELYQELRAFVAELKARPWRLLKKDSDKKKKWFFFF